MCVCVCPSPAAADRYFIAATSKKKTSQKTPKTNTLPQVTTAGVTSNPHKQQVGIAAVFVLYSHYRGNKITSSTFLLKRRKIKINR